VGFERFDVVLVPFPFTDKDGAKRRPALVLSCARAFGDPAGHSVLAMITSSKHPSWPLDTEIDDLVEAGLPAPSKVRMKLFTLDHRLVIAKVGTLSPADSARVAESLGTLLGSARRLRRP
jgi:mRNA interferase MazF